MDGKRCFKCGETKDRGEFYTHPRMADGLLGKCKECTKRDIKEHRQKNIDRIRLYDKQRSNTPGRKLAFRKKNKQWRERYPEKRKAHKAVHNAINCGLLTRMPCEMCGTIENVQGHHDDYSKPLEVKWLCDYHHREWHKHNKTKDAS